MKIIKTIDVWRMGISAAEIFLQAIYDEFLLENGEYLYNKIEIISNCNIEWKLEFDEILKAYSNMALFLKDDEPVKVLFLKNCNLQKVSEYVFSETCLPGKLSINDLVKAGKMEIEIKDLKQATNVIEHGHVQIGSCNTLPLLKSMASGFVTVDETGELKYRVDEIIYAPEFVCTISAETDKFKFEIKHKGRIKISDARWILIQDNGSFTEEEINKIIKGTRPT